MSLDSDGQGNNNPPKIIGGRHRFFTPENKLLQIGLRIILHAKINSTLFFLIIVHFQVIYGGQRNMRKNMLNA